MRQANSGQNGGETGKAFWFNDVYSRWRMQAQPAHHKTSVASVAHSTVRRIPDDSAGRPATLQSVTRA